MKVTSSELKKIIDRKNLEKDELKSAFINNAKYSAIVGEDLNLVKPKISPIETLKKIEALEYEILKLKHALNKFNIETSLVSGVTIDEALVLLPMLNARKYQLSSKVQEKEIDRKTLSSGVVEYTYLNYDLNEMKEEYNKLIDKISTLQNELDIANTTISFEI